MTKGLLIYGEKFAHFLKHKEALAHIWLCTWSHLNFLIYEESFVRFFISALNSSFLCVSTSELEICLLLLLLHLLDGIVWNVHGEGAHHHPKNRKADSCKLEWNSWTAFLVEISGHTVNSSLLILEFSTLIYCMYLFYTKLFMNGLEFSCSQIFVHEILKPYVRTSRKFFLGQWWSPAAWMNFL